MATLQKLKSIAVKKDDEDEEKWLKYYSSSHQILLVGDGDFSFSLCLATAFGSAANIVATSLDSHDEVIKKYKNGKLNIKKLKKLGAQILHGVDATKMMRHSDLKGRKFDRIVFNFPHAGFHGKEENIGMIRMHQTLLCGFFNNASSMLRRNGEVHVNHKTTLPYSSWNLEELASRNSLSLTERTPFELGDYPGYSNKRGGHPRCDMPFPLGESSTYKFILSGKTIKRFRTEVKHQSQTPQHQNGTSSRHPEPLSSLHYTYPKLSITHYIDGANRQYDGYLKQMMESFVRSDANVAFSLHEELRQGFIRYMTESPQRTVNGYIYLLCELQRLSISGSAWLRMILGINPPPHY
ncbi:unnamed protein product [Rhodiola kirilowii]